MFVFTVNAFGSSVTRITLMSQDEVLEILKSICPTFTDFRYKNADADVIGKLSVPIKYTQNPLHKSPRGSRPSINTRRKSRRPRRKPLKRIVALRSLRAVPVEKSNTWFGSADYQRTFNLWFFEDELQRLNLIP